MLLQFKTRETLRLLGSKNEAKYRTFYLCKKIRGGTANLKVPTYDTYGGNTRTLGEVGDIVSARRGTAAPYRPSSTTSRAA